MADPAVVADAAADLATWQAAGTVKPVIGERYAARGRRRGAARALEERRAVGNLVLVL